MAREESDRFVDGLDEARRFRFDRQSHGDASPVVQPHQVAHVVENVARHQAHIFF